MLVLLLVLMLLLCLLLLIPMITIRVSQSSARGHEGREFRASADPKAVELRVVVNLKSDFRKAKSCVWGIPRTGVMGF